MFAEVILARITPALDKIYHYSIPDNIKGAAHVGSQVLIPFGKTKTVGYIVGFVETSDIKGIKDIAQVLSPYPLFSKELIELAKWVSERYNSFFISALRLLMPPATATTEKRALKTNLRKPLYAVLKDVQKDKKVVIDEAKTPRFTLTDEQKLALSSIEKDIDTGKATVTLLYGVTGSGKTEVYLRAAEYIIFKGGTAIILVPEIGLTPQMIERAANRFKDGMAIYYSNMSEKDRQRTWEDVATEKVKVVLGTRSALFLPFKGLKLIVLDEEYENTYKSDQSPRYHSRDVALEYSRMTNAHVILGSATPSIESFYKAKKGEYKLLTLTKRIDERPMPEVKVADMKKELNAKNFHVLSRELESEIKATYQKKQQSILFINRRGYFSFVMCRSCGHVIQCPKCSRSLIYHMADKKLRCNHCNFTMDSATVCPKCNSTQIKYFGGGTQRIEQEVANLIPKARILRLDRDTVTKRGSYEAIIRSFIEGSADVLIGTQMVTKGLDVASVTLVGVVAADIGLNMPDFRAAEHVFQMITQVAGRAGRHKLPGKVIVQTYDPDNYAIQFAAKHDYEGFYNKEIEQRRELGYPPFEELINITISAEEEKNAAQTATDLAELIEKRVGNAGVVFGPAIAPVSKLKNMYRYQIMLKGKDGAALRKAASESQAIVVKLGKARVTVDVDPINML